nr:reverse transcriptase domain-containing protein [Tanacetum cinerariifolium]
MGIYTPYSRRVTFTPLTKTPNEILAMEGMSFPKPPPLIGTLENHNLNKFYDCHGDKGHNTNDCYQLKKQIEEAVALGKLAHLVKDICQSNQRNGSQGRNDVKLPEKNYSLGTSAKITRAKLDKYSRDAGMSMDMLGASSEEAELIKIFMNAKKAKNKVDLQPIEEEVQGTEMRYVGTETQKGTTGPTSQTQTTPSPSTNFIKENIDILRTMIKELDHQTKAKATPRKLIYVDSEKESPDRSEGSLQRQRTITLRRSKRLENQSRTMEIERRKKSKPIERSEYKETSTDSEYEEGSKDTCEDMNSPYKRPKATPFTTRITHFTYHRRGKLPRNIRVYKENKDPEDHLSIFSAAVEQEEWLMPI